MTVKKASFCLFSLYLGYFLYREIWTYAKPLFGPLSPLDFMLIDKTILAIGLLVIVYAFGIHRQCGLVLKVNWRTLRLYWPVALLALLTLTGGITESSTSTLIKIALFSLVGGGIAEELMFRGMVFYWFESVSLRKQILISALAFGGMHLFGLFSHIDAPVILAQAYFAAGLGVIFAYARSQDYSILLPILVHTLFDVVAIGSKGGISETFVNDEILFGLLFAGTITWAWGGYLLWKAGEKGNPALAPSTI